MKCKHKFISKESKIAKMMPFDGWYKATKTIIFCEKCGKVSYEKIDDAY